MKGDMNIKGGAVALEAGHLSGSARVVPVLLFFLSGFTALLYQVIWLKMLTLTFGNTVYAVSTLLGSFMAGLALGGYWFGRIADRASFPLRLYGYLEGLIGAVAALTPLLFKWIEPVYIGIYQSSNQNPYLFGLSRFVLSLAILIVPTTLMGGTLPLLARHLTASYGHLGIRIGGLYAINTLGAAAGTFVTGFYLILALGLKGTVLLGSIMNLTIMLVVLVMGRASPAIKGKLVDVPRAVRKPLWLSQKGGGLVFLFFLIGIASLAYEVFWTRILVLYLGSSVYAYSLMLSIFLLGLTLGSFLVGVVIDRIKRLTYVLAFLELAIGFYLILQIVQFSQLPDLMGRLGVFFGRPSYWKSVAVLSLGTVNLLLVPTLLMGAAFPLGVKIYARWNRWVGKNIGNLYSANTLGCIGGSLLAGFLLIPWLGIQRGMVVIALANLGIGIYLIIAEKSGRIWQRALVGAALLGLFLIGYHLFCPPNSVVLSAGVFTTGSNRMVVSFREDVTATVSVEKIHDLRGDWLSMSVNGVNVAGTSPDLLTIQKMQGHLPLLLHKNPKRVLHIGLGSGGTAWSVSTHAVEEIHIAEISPGVVEAAGDYFQGVNHGILHDGRVELTICDGRNFLLATEKRYDIILSDSIHPRYAGNGSLYTRDYYLMCRKKLNPGGIVSQWLPLYSLSEENFKMLLRTFQSVFPHTTVWYINSTINPFTIVIGRTEGGKIDFSALQKGWDERGVRLDLQEAGVEKVFHLLDYFVMGEEEVRRYAGEGPLHTDDYPAIEYLASKVISREASWHWNFRAFVSQRVPVLSYLINFSKSDLEREEILSTLEKFYQATTHNLRGQLYFLEGRYKEMASEMEQIPEINPDDLEPWEYFRLLKYKLDITGTNANQK